MTTRIMNRMYKNFMMIIFILLTMMVFTIVKVNGAYDIRLRDSKVKIHQVFDYECQKDVNFLNHNVV